MRDQRIERRPALGGVEPRDGGAVGGVGAEPVDGLGRERDQAAVGEAARGVGDGRAFGGNDAGVDRVGHFFFAPPSRGVWPALRAAALAGSLGRIDLDPVEIAFGFEVLQPLEQPRHRRAVAMPGQQQEFLAHLGAVERLLRRALEARRRGG